jgi:hypothetical protein
MAQGAASKHLPTGGAVSSLLFWTVDWLSWDIHFGMLMKNMLSCKMRGVEGTLRATSTVMDSL